MSDNKIKIGITHADANGDKEDRRSDRQKPLRPAHLRTGARLSSTARPRRLGFYKKQIEEAENLGFNIVGSAAEANPKRINLINCCSDELRVEPGEDDAGGGSRPRSPR